MILNGIDIEREKKYRVIQHLILRLMKTADAALAEVEVLAVGDNVGWSTVARGEAFERGTNYWCGIYV